MTSRDRILIAVVAAVVAAAAFWFFALAPKREAIQTADAELTAQQARLTQAQQLLATAEGAKRDYQADYAAVTELGKAVPADDNMASLVYELQAVAGGESVDFRSLKLASGSAAAAPPAPAPAAGASGDAASGAAAPATQVSAAQLPPGATVGTAGLATMPFTFEFEGKFLDMQRFLAGLDRLVRVQDDKVLVNGRLLTVDGISLAAGAKGLPRVKATIAATAYINPADAAADAAASSVATPSDSSAATPPATASGSANSTAVVAAPAS